MSKFLVAGKLTEMLTGRMGACQLLGSRCLSASAPPLPTRKLSPSQVDSLTNKLTSVLGKEKVSLAEAVRLQHCQDEGPEHGVLSDLVVYAQSTEEVSEICKACYADDVPIIPYGTGTGLEAGISAVYGGVCIDMSKMDEIHEFHPEDFDVKVRPGVTREGLNHFVKSEGLWFTVDPGANASICGMCATAASGTNAFKYGTIKENCLNLEVVLSDGRVLHTGGEGNRPRKSAAGYNLTNLFIGSEGTLGVITGATLKLHAVPEAISAAVVDFPDIKSAVQTVVQTLQCAIPVDRMELLDDVSVQASNDYSKLNLSERPTLFLEFNSGVSGDTSHIEMVKDIATANGGSDFEWASQQEDRTKLWTARHKLYYASINMKPGYRSVTTDACVPISRLPEMLTETRKDIEAAGITAPLFGHVADGNFHAVLLFDPNDPEDFMKCKELSRKMSYRAIDMGGTCTGEHGIGTGKRRLLKHMIGDTGIEIMRSIKYALDPKGIMNPGKVIPLVD